MIDPVRVELKRRLQIWAGLLRAGGPKGVTTSVVRGVGIYGGAQGVWVDRASTGGLTKDSNGITVGLLHTGRAYPDELSEDGLIYHYPSTARGVRDRNEIKATKSARELGLPVFVITQSSPNSSKRNIDLAWVEDWDDDYGAFLVAFGDRPAAAPGDVDDEPFELEAKTSRVTREVITVLGQQRFKFRVFQRYGPKCALCDMRVREVLDAAHLRPRSARGTDDPRNALVLCALHHRALDAGLFAIHPDTLVIHCHARGPDAGSLGVVHPTIEHLRRKPHRSALDWGWRRWRRVHPGRPSAQHRCQHA
jgi:putative restriction endonuclease